MLAAKACAATMFHRSSPTRVPPWSLLAVFLLVCLSPVWLPWASDAFLAAVGLLAGRGEATGRGWEDAARAYAAAPPQAGVERLRWEAAALARENAALRADLQRAAVLRKAFGPEATGLSVEVVGRASRPGRQLWIVNAGRDLQVRAGDLLVQDRVLLGRVVGVAGRSALVEGVSARKSRLIVRVEGLEEERMWEGDGEGKGRIQVPEAAGRGLLGRRVWLSPGAAPGEGLELGEVVGLEDGTGGMVHLLAKAGAVRPGLPFLLLQPPEEPGSARFVQRDRLAALREELRRLELEKQKAELMRR